MGAASNHFDAGYADITAGVVNMYFDTCVHPLPDCCPSPILFFWIYQDSD